MDLLEAIRERRAVRDYSDEPLSGQVIDALIGTAVWAPSSMNRQGWAFLVVEDRARMAEMSDLAKAHLGHGAVDQPELALLAPMLADEGFNLFYNAPALVIVCATARDRMALNDACLAAATLMLAAHGAGVGSCWIGLAEPWLESPQARAWLAIPPGHVPVAPIILGHAAGRPSDQTRKSPVIVRPGQRTGS